MMHWGGSFAFCGSEDGVGATPFFNGVTCEMCLYLIDMHIEVSLHVDRETICFSKEDTPDPHP